MFPQKQNLNRRGVTLVESAIVCSVLFVTLFTMLDLALAVLHYNSLSEAARRVARVAMVRGENKTSLGKSWGPATYTGTVADVSTMSDVARPILIAMTPADISILAEWPDGGNEVDDRVRITLTYPYEPLFTFGTGLSTLELSATSTMRISH